ncbi:Ku70-binding family protein [Striga hermonthica]|uniref:Mitochondrial inner membrane protease ATP23 n=1 Tax=Striga hermonthica TaxID=68872 RepID=A0A9N7NR39_STRHE|nr:Ku70-binding family protein [Striga hermonthica]
MTEYDPEKSSNSHSEISEGTPGEIRMWYWQQFHKGCQLQIKELLLVVMLKAKGNHLQIQDEVTQVVIHELIHAYDEWRSANLDWSDCAHHACSEIRAGHLSGDCHYKRELLRGFMKLRGHEQDFVQRRVMKSVTANPYCSEASAKDAMEAVWDICYNDTKPFDRAP